MWLMHYKFIKIFLLLFMLLILVSCNSITDPIATECSYVAKVSQENLEPQLKRQGICGEFFDEDTLLIYSKHFDKMDFGEDNLTSLYTNNGIFYVSKLGKVKRTFLFDNGADYFEEGLTRILKEKKFGFMDKKLKVVIIPQYDFAFPFQNAKAVVCNGCKQKKEEHKEYMQIVGGKWGAIDKQGSIIIPMVYDSKEIYQTLAK
ncbi:MAG: Unknown protein [uncultured Sulfurovum sp.]|uniref:WG repeat-containing protein n=1 Tax=uncultured Sulfurovum sp. TaxID=269237 RepID=A0A6S6U050_9BACT|nr:MAG: Unknown protein [uncultured Sulfurovum sp.]